VVEETVLDKVDIVALAISRDNLEPTYEEVKCRRDWPKWQEATKVEQDVGEKGDLGSGGETSGEECGGV
jgi:hypothetical protein